MVEASGLLVLTTGVVLWQMFLARTFTFMRIVTPGLS
ncbi:hypothetical protein HMPREF0975_02554 [Actinomyces sp. oral taxon 849 str. F0330]|nr:hypothetical protein HMPREF0975_02554 [Actinomyces sp. oral taxon 849 str. F0330]